MNQFEFQSNLVSQRTSLILEKLRRILMFGQAICNLQDDSPF